MLLRTKILVAFLTSFLIVGVILLGQNLRARTIIEKTAVLEIASAHEIIWDKILQETNRELLLYALKGEPGSSSIWALRGSRSPISAIETRKPKLIKRALGKYFEALREEGILDHILIFDNHETLLYHFGGQNEDVMYTVQLDWDEIDEQLKLAGIDYKIALQLAFPIFSNGRSIGTVLYAKELATLVERFEKDTKAQIVSNSDLFKISDQPKQDFKQASPVSKFDFFNSAPSFSSTLLSYPLGNSTIVLEIAKDITETVNANNASFVSSLIAITAFMLLISGIVYIILARGFEPLSLAITALEALAKGDMSVNIEQKRNDEVGQISSAVQAFRKTAIEFEAMKEKSQIAQRQQRDKIYQASKDMASLLPEEVAIKIRNDISKNIELSNQRVETKGLFNTSQDQSLMLVEKLFSLLSKEISDQFHKQRSLTEAYQRFVPRELLLNLNKPIITDVMPGDHVQKNVSVLFSDIRSFTTLAEELSPEKTFRLLNDYIAAVMPEITNQRGYVDKFIGDAIMAIFTEHPANSVVSAVQILKALQRFNDNEINEGSKPLQVGIGINTGPVILGTLGTEGRLEGTVIGDTVNVAARLETLTKTYKCPLLISENTFEFLKSFEDGSLSNMCRKLDVAEVKGKLERVAIYEVFAWQNADIIAAKISSKSQFEKAVSMKASADPELAAKLLEAYCKQNPADNVAHLQFSLSQGN